MSISKLCGTRRLSPRQLSLSGGFVSGVSIHWSCFLGLDITLSELWIFMEARFHFPASCKEGLVIVFGLQKTEHQNGFHFSVSYLVRMSELVSLRTAQAIVYFPPTPPWRCCIITEFAKPEACSPAPHAPVSLAPGHQQRSITAEQQHLWPMGLTGSICMARSPPGCRAQGTSQPNSGFCLIWFCK